MRPKTWSTARRTPCSFPRCARVPTSKISAALGAPLDRLHAAWLSTCTTPPIRNHQRQLKQRYHSADCPSAPRSKSFGLTQLPNTLGPNEDMLYICPDPADAQFEGMPCGAFISGCESGYLSAAPRSRHPGGVNAVFLDGHVGFSARFDQRVNDGVYDFQQRRSDDRYLSGALRIFISAPRSSHIMRNVSLLAIIVGITSGRGAVVVAGSRRRSTAWSNAQAAEYSAGGGKLSSFGARRLEQGQASRQRKPMKPKRVTNGIAKPWNKLAPPGKRRRPIMRYVGIAIVFAGLMGAAASMPQPGSTAASNGGSANHA